MTGRHPRIFTFELALGAIDAASCAALHDYLGVGNVTLSLRRHAHYDDEVALQVRSLRELVEVVVPFIDEHLPPSYKRLQYVDWRTALLEYWEHKAKRPRPCTRDGCEELRRAKGLCRRHYYAAYGK